MRKFIFILFLSLGVQNIQAQYIQSGTKLFGNNVEGTSSYGSSLSFSADGNTVLVGGYSDDTNNGAAWIYTFNGSNYVQAGNKLVGSDATGASKQGYAVSMSANGKIAVVGGYADNASQGAVWVYTFNGSNYIQLGTKITGTGASGAAAQGSSVSISADGKILVLGGSSDNALQGAIWVFTFNGNGFVQYGNKLVGTGATGAARQGSSVNISADGKTIAVGGIGDNTGLGAVWVYTFNGTGFIQYGSQLVGTGAIGAAGQGSSVSLSDDGETVLIGADSDGGDGYPGAAWIFTFNGSNYEQAGNKLTGNDTVAGTYGISQGSSVSLSSDGKTAIIGGKGDNGSTGAVWVYTFNGSNYIQSGTKLVGTGGIGSSAQGCSVGIAAGKNIIFAGASDDKNYSGALWVFTFNGTGYEQFGNKLSGTGKAGNALQGYSVSISADGKTALAGGPLDASGYGAAWVYTFIGNNFVQTGDKLTTSDLTSANANQGIAVSLSADGKTALVGGSNDVDGGSAIIYTFNGSNFIQVGYKLGGIYLQNLTANFGSAVSLSADGKTALIGSTGMNSGQGGAWIYVYNGFYYEPLCSLSGTGSVGASAQGRSVSLSGDGKTAVIGGEIDDNSTGAAWVFTYNGSNFIQVGNKLAGAYSFAEQGTSVSISENGKTILVGAPADNAEIGSILLYTFNGTNYAQAGPKIGSTGFTGKPKMGSSVSLSADGKTAFAGGPFDNAYQGATWVFTFNGTNYVQSGHKLVCAGTSSVVLQGSSISASADGKKVIIGIPYDNNYEGGAWLFSYSDQNQTVSGMPVLSSTYQYGHVPVTLSGVTATSGLPVSITSSNLAVVSIAGGKLIFSGIGVTTVTAFQPGNSFFTGSNYIVQIVSVTKGDQAISFPGLGDMIYTANAIITVSGIAASSGLPVQITITGGNATVISNNTATGVLKFQIINPGSITIIASQPGDNRYNAASTVQNVFTATLSTPGILNIAEAKSVDQFEIYPNPSSGSFTIKRSQQGSDVEVYNSVGSYITTLTESEAALPKGLYLLRCGKTCKKLVIE